MGEGKREREREGWRETDGGRRKEGGRVREQETEGGRERLSSFSVLFVVLLDLQLMMFLSISMTMFVLQAVDRHFKLPHASSKPGKTSYSLGDSAYKTLRFALRATLKTAIYRITTTFREHLQ